MTATTSERPTQAQPHEAALAQVLLNSLTLHHRRGTTFVPFAQLVREFAPICSREELREAVDRLVLARSAGWFANLDCLTCYATVEGRRCAIGGSWQ